LWILISAKAACKQAKTGYFFEDRKPWKGWKVAFLLQGSSRFDSLTGTSHDRCMKSQTDLRIK
jgi:hypothetical protein